MFRCAPWLRDYSDGFFTTVYGLRYGYDRDGRRTWTKLPANMASVGSDSMAYAYSPANGALIRVRDGANRRDSLTYTPAGRLDSLKVFAAGSSAPGIKESRHYDADGRMTSRERRTGANAVLQSDSLVYDARGDVVTAFTTSAAVNQGTLTTSLTYDGMGAVVASQVQSGTTWNVEEFRTDGLGNVWYQHNRTLAGGDAGYQLSTYTGNQQLSERDGAPPPTCGVTIYDDRLYTATDPAGNVIREGELHLDCSATGYSTQTYTNSYYSADNRLAVVQRVPYGNAAGTGSWEEYRYDAMGRRVMTRARRDSALCTQSQSITCVSFVERVVWDGDQILYEQRTSGLDVITGGAPNYGTVGYVHALGIDRPVHLLGDGRVIHYNWRRLGEASSWADGSTDDCQLTTGTCTTIPWPAGEGVYYRRATNPYAGLTITWIGNLPANGANTTGQLYRRNRYYDAASGRFTQEDPIGLAGGLNLYGFAGGDPVNFSDPFGLCPLGNCTQSQRHYEVDAAGDQFIKGSETFKTRPYDDGVGNATIGYGHVIQAGDNFPSGGIDRQEADALYESDKERIVQPGLDKISNPSLNQNQVNALGSYIFNAGPGHFQRRILPSINAGNYKTATDAMVGSTIGRNLTTGETRSLPGLQTRRQAEINLFYKQP